MTSRTLRRTQQERRAETERRLLDATAALVSREGSSGVTLAAVGSLAGYSRGIVSHQFGSKQGLLEAFARAAQQRVAPQEDQAAGFQRLHDFVETYIERLRVGDSYARAFLLLWAESVAAAAELRGIFVERDQTIGEEILGDLRAARRAGAVRAGLDIRGTTAALIAQLRGIGLQVIIAGDDFDSARARDAVLDGLRHNVLAESHCAASRPARR